MRFQKIQNKSSSWGSCNYHSQISGWHPPHISYTISSFQHQKFSSFSCTFTCKMLSTTEVMDAHFPCIFIIITWVFWFSWMGPGIKFWNPYYERNSHIQNSLGRQFSALVTSIWSSLNFRMPTNNVNFSYPWFFCSTIFKERITAAIFPFHLYFLDLTRPSKKIWTMRHHSIL